MLQLSDQGLAASLSKQNSESSRRDFRLVLARAVTELPRLLGAMAVTRARSLATKHYFGARQIRSVHIWIQLEIPEARYQILRSISTQVAY